MIKLNLEWAVNPPDIYPLADVVSKIHRAMESNTCKGAEYLGWKNLPVTTTPAVLESVRATARFFHKEGVKVLVVIGIGGSYLGAKAGISMIQGLFFVKQKMEVVFAGISLSANDLVQKLKYVENKRFAINVISKSGTTLETLLTFRYFKRVLEEQIGTHNAKRFIVVTTDANQGPLHNLAVRQDYKRFVIPEDVGGRFSVLTPVGLLPMACAGCDVNAVLHGAKQAYKMYANPKLLENAAYQYAVARYLLGKRFPVELFVFYEPQLASFGEWVKQLFGESEGKNERGLLPIKAVYTRDLHSLGQFVQEGSKVLFETVIQCETTTADLPMLEIKDDYDNLNTLVRKTVHQVNTTTAEAVRAAHESVGNVPNVMITIGKMDAFHAGELFYFFEKACAMSAYLLNVNPFNQPGVEVYKLNIKNLLGLTNRKK